MTTMLTTIDNPFDPFTQYDNWVSYDEQAGYFTNEYIARIANINPTMTDKEVDEAIDNAINEIVLIDPIGVYFKVTKENE